MWEYAIMGYAKAWIYRITTPEIKRLLVSTSEITELRTRYFRKQFQNILLKSGVILFA